MRIIVLVFVGALVAAPDFARACECAHNGTRHVFLQYDYMVAADHTHAPDPAAIDLVVAAYRRHGIILHIDPQHDAIPETRVITFDGGAPAGCVPGAVRFEDLKATHFRASQPDKRYAIFAHDAWCDTPEQCSACNAAYGSLGYANGIGGVDLIVTLGLFWDEPSLSAPPDLIAQGGVLMHELGHTLGLRHGGFEDLDWKPNYLSVMNNLFIADGIRSAAAPGLTEVVARRLDYSADVLPPLTESALDETRGIGAGTTDISLYVCTYQCVIDGVPTTCTDQRYAPASGPVDWSCENGIDAALVSEDLNADGQMTPIIGFDDWSAVRHFLDNPGQGICEAVREPGMRRW